MHGVVFLLLCMLLAISNAPLLLAISNAPLLLAISNAPLLLAISNAPLLTLNTRTYSSISYVSLLDLHIME